MSIDSPRTELQLRSLVKRSGELELSLASVPIPEPAPNEVLVAHRSRADQSVRPRAALFGPPT